MHRDIAVCQVDSIYTDFSKAFDSVSHFVLEQKLYSLGIQNSLLKWLHNYLTGRSQVVKIKSFISKEIKVTSGVPQGSHLGPLLFLIFINDIGEILKDVSFLLFADDLKIYLRISSEQDHVRLQNAINALLNWCRLNKMHLNASKCKLMSFYRSRSPVKFLYKIHDEVLESCDTIKDLGITFDNSLSFNAHISSVVNPGA